MTPLKVSHHPAKFGGHRHYGSGDRMFLVVEVQDSSCRCFNPPLVFIFKVHGMPCSHRKFQNVGTIISLYVHWKNSSLGHTGLQKQLTEIT